MFNIATSNLSEDMVNRDIAKIFFEIADYLEMDRVAFKPFAYRRAALALESLEEDVRVIYQRGGPKALEEISGVGKNIAQHIEEYLKTGRMKYYQQFKSRLPLKLEELMAVEGLGPRRVKFLYQKLGIHDLKSLEKAAKIHKIAPLFGFGEKTEKNILQGIEFVKRSKGRFLLGEIMPRAREVYGQLQGLREVERVDMAGSLRRMKETIGDVDFLVISPNPKPIMDFFVSLPGVVKVWGKGATKSSVRMAEGFDMDIRVVPKRSYGSALQYFTGSVEHNIATRKIAIDKGLKLSEYGLFRGSKMIAGETEEDIYRALGMDWIPPELRENRGEIEAALNKRLPRLFTLKDIKGDLHCHSDWDGGKNTIEELARAARERGYEYLGISDHTKFLRIEHGLDEEKIARRNKEIDRLNEKLKKKNEKFRILKGVEANILNDGSIDIADETLAELDFVIAGVHSNMKMPRDQMTKRMLKAMQNPNIDIISHPTGRLLKERDEHQIDLEKILEAAKITKTLLEINSNPQRLDLNDINIRKAKEQGVKMVINADTHQKDQLRFMEYGIYQARRGWAEKADIINCWPLEKLLNYFK